MSTCNQTDTYADFPSEGVAVVTGGSGGVGAEICRILVNRGVRVALTYRSSYPEELLAALGELASAHQLDVQDPQACAALVQELVTHHGGIHTLVHAAGPHVPMIHLSRVEPDRFREQVEADLVGFFNIAQPTLEPLRTSQGSIVVVTSAATRRYPV